MYAYRADGSTVFSVPRIPATNILPNGSTGSSLAIDGLGNAYIAIHNSPRATKVTPDTIAAKAHVLQEWDEAAPRPNGRMKNRIPLDDRGESR